MGCPRCQGLLLEEDGERRCVNCGHRECVEGGAVPKFTSEESRQRWVEAVRRTKAKNKAQRGALYRGDALPGPVAVPLRSTDVAVVPSLDDKIAQLRAELEILEKARDILTR